MGMTVREALRARIEMLQAKKTRHLADAQACQAEIDALRDIRDGLLSGDDDRFAQLQALGVIEAKS